MKKNLGTADRIIRTLAALVIGYLIYDGTLAGTVGTILGVIAIVLLLTSLVSFCPLYFVLKLSTLKKTEAPQ